MNYTGFGQPLSFYTLSGGPIGGANIWNTGMKTIRPETQAVSRAMGKKGVQVLPAGAGSRQELRYLRERSEQQGYGWTEAPERYTQGGRELDRYGRIKDPTGYYTPMGKKFTGTTMWVGDGWKGHTAHGESGRIETDEGSYAWGQQRGGYKKPKPIFIPTESKSGFPFPTGTIGSLTGFGGIPRFPARTPNFLSGNY